MNGLELHPPKRRWEETLHAPMQPLQGMSKLLTLAAGGELSSSSSLCSAAGPPPPVTVVLDGRSICHRICLDKHTGYESLAKALRRIFVDDDGAGDLPAGLSLANAVPGHLVAYEDLEDDLLLVGDLNWKDFVRVAKRIRIVPAKSSRRKHRREE